MGNIVELGGRLRLHASLYDRQRGSEPVATASSEQVADSVAVAVNHVATELIGQSAGRSAGQRIRQAGMETTSLDALRAYVEGEREFRAGRYRAARDAFREATRRDSAFALAWYRLSVAADWSGIYDSLPRHAALVASRHADRLSPRHRMLLDALVAWRREDAEEAERRYRLVVEQYPSDFEAWFQLGEVLFHNAPMMGRSFREARPALERALSLEPGDRESLLHLARIAAFENKLTEADALLARLVGLYPEEATLELRAFRAFVVGGASDQLRLLDELRRAGHTTISNAAWRIGVYGDRLDAAQRILSLLTDPSRPPRERGAGHYQLAALHLARGQLRAAQKEAERARQLPMWWAIDTRIMLATPPFGSSSKSELLVLRDSVATLHSTSPPWPPAPNSAPDTSLLATRHRQLGMFSALLGDSVAVRTRVAALSRALAPPILAHFARRRGDPPGVLTSVADIPPGHATADVRYLHAEALEAMGRDEHAVRGYGTFEQVGLSAMAYAGHAHLRRGRIYERLGRRDAAIAACKRFLELWRDSDPESRPLLSEAAAAVVRLERDR